MDQPIVLHEEQVNIGKNKVVTLQLIIPGAVELDYLKNYIASLALPAEDEMYFDDYDMEGEKPTERDLEADRNALHFWIESERAPWDKVFKKLARKKNGTFAKARKMRLHRIAVSEHGYSEEAYGFYGDELRICNIDDTTAVLCIENIIRKYDEPRHSLDPATL